jgi:chitinase
MKTAALLSLAMASAASAQGDNCQAVSPIVTDGWCDLNCNFTPPNCPAEFCDCSGGSPPSPTTAPPAPTTAPPAPSNAPPSPTSPPAPIPPAPAGQKVIGYYTSWLQYQDANFDLTASEAALLTHVNYAFATVQYSPSVDAWYLGPTDTFADMDKCFDGPCFGNQPDVDADCIVVGGPDSRIPDATIFNAGGTNPTVNLAPWIGAPGDRLLNQQSDCYFAGGAPMFPRQPACVASLDSVRHPTVSDPSDWNSPRYPTVCGLYSHTTKALGRQYPHLRWVLSVGGWYDSNYFTEAVKDQYREGFIKSIVEYTKAFGFDGIDIDWEYPGFEHGQMPLMGDPEINDGEDAFDCAKVQCQDDRSNDGEMFNVFLAELKVAMKGAGPNPHDEEYIVTIAAPAGFDKYEKVDLNRMCESLDFVNIMTYDMSGAFDSETNHQGPIIETDPSNAGRRYSVDDAIVAHLDAGCPAEKLIMGIPFYARQFDNVQGCDDSVELPGLRSNFTGPDVETCVTSPIDCVPAYKDIVNRPLETYYDNEADSVYSIEKNTGANTGCKLYSYDTPESIDVKGQYARDKGLGGYMYWAIGQDTPNNDLLQALNRNL